MQHELIDDGTTTTEHLVDIAYYAADGRLKTVTDNTGTYAKVFTYNYK